MSKYLLIQIRESAKIKQEEFDSFVKYSKEKKEYFDSYDVFKDPPLAPELISQYKAIFVGGASDASVLKPEAYSFVPSLIDFLNYCVEKSIPTFASCFGFQAAILALNGEVIHQANDFEMGTYPISLTPEAKEDNIFKDTPNGFFGISVHKEKALILPKNCIKLAYTENCVHAFKVINKPFYAFQFHPELDRQTLIDRLAYYQAQYTENPGHYQEIIDSTVETPESNDLVRKFVQRIVNS